MSDPQILVKIEPGHDIVSALELAMRDRRVRHGAVASLIGALDSATVSTMAGDYCDIPTTCTGPYELSGNGEIIDGAAHLHVVLSAYAQCIRAGHLIEGLVAEPFFVRVYVLPFG